MHNKVGPFNGEINPLESFGKSREWSRKQHEALKRTAEGLRQIGAIITDPRGRVDLAHTVLDNLAKEFRKGHSRFADMNLHDIGISHKMAHVLEESSIFTVGDLSNCCATKMPLTLDVVDCLKATLAVLKRVVQLDQERAA